MRRHLSFLIMLILAILTGAVSAAEENFTSWQQMDGKVIGTLTGSTGGPALEKNLPEAKIAYYDSITDIITALESHKIDGACMDKSFARYLSSEKDNLRILDGSMGKFANAPVFPKNQKGRDLEKQYSEFVKKLWEDGSIDEIDAVWFGGDQSKWDVPDYENLPDTNGTLHMAADPTMPPFAMMVNNRIAGYDVDIAARFCEAYGYRLEIEPMSFAAVIPAVISGKCDFASSCITITEERAENVLFSEPIYHDEKGIIVLKTETGNKAGPQKSIPEYTGFSDLSGKTVSMLTGAPFEELVRSKVPDVGGFSYYSNMADIILALKSGKTDACLNNNAIAQLAANRDPDIALFPHSLEDGVFGFAFAKGSPDREQWQAAFDKIDQDTIQALWEKWSGADESKKVIPEQDWPGLNGTVKAAVCDTLEPMSYVGANGQLMGFDIEMILLTAKELDVHVDFIGMEFSAILASVQSGKALLGAGSIIVTDERKEAVDFVEYFPAAFVLVVRSMPNPMQNTSDQPVSVIDKLNGKRIGVQTGQAFDKMIMERLPEAKITYVNSKADLVNSLMTGKIDTYAVDEPVIKSQMHENTNLSYIPEYLSEFDFGYVFAKNEKGKRLRDQFSEFIDQIKADKTLAEIESKWMNPDENLWTIPDYESFPAENGTLVMATEALYQPFTFIYHNKIVGYDIDIAARFCEAYGYGLEIIDMSFSGILPSVQAGKADFGGAGITITAERAENIYFSEPNYSGGVVFAVLSSFMGAYNSAASDSENAISASGNGYGPLSLDDLNGKRIGIQSGTNYDEMVQKRLPDAKILYFNNKADLNNALMTDKIDGYAIDLPVIILEMSDNDALTFIPEYLDTCDFAYILPKNKSGEKLREKINEFLEKITSDGTLLEILNKWLTGDRSLWTIDDYESFPAENGTIRLATDPTYEPLGFVFHNKVMGYEVDIIAHFCRANGYKLEIVNTNYDSVLSSVQSYKADIGAGGIAATDERSESVLFSEPYYHGGTVMAVLKQEKPAESAPQNSVDTSSYPEGENTSLSEPAGKKIGVPASLWESISESFERTFIREDRYKLFGQGVLTTLLITVLSILFGTMLGFCIFMLCRNGNLFANRVTNVCLWIVQGMPGVVLLMILYYVIFGSVSISGIWVAVIGFTLTFGAAVFGLLKMGVGAVDEGQYEAAYALGYSNSRTFFRIILPQAIPHVVDAYKGEIVSLLKGTAIVGYIAVQDLTKMGDIVRSRTYEAFFPLIAVTIIYFLLEMLLGSFVKGIRIQIDPKRRSRKTILKGVNTNDQN